MDIWDIDAIQAMWIIRRMRDEGQFWTAARSSAPRRSSLVLRGSPYASTPLIQAMREGKLNAGAQFHANQPDL